MDLAITPGRKGPFPEDIAYPANGDSYGALLVAEQGAKFQEWMRRGWIFTARSGAAAAIPIYSTATNAPTLWNPSSSQKLIVPIRITLSQTTVGAMVSDGFVVCTEAGMGDAYGTNFPFPTWATIAANSTLVGSGNVARGRFANGTVTWTTQPTPNYDTGMNQIVQGTAASGGMAKIDFEFDGTFGLLPGAAMCLAGEIASVSSYWTSFMWAELPLAQNM